MSRKILLCTDLDRTLLPNGPQPESPEAPLRFRMFAARTEVTLAYVTGRHQALVKQAIEEYSLPIPDYVLADVGSTIYEIVGTEWLLWEQWDKEIAQDWAGFTHKQIALLFTDISQLRVQEPSKQAVHKLSYYLSLDNDHAALIDEMRIRLEEQNIAASLIWSVDEASGIGLLDVLPERATKLHAVQFLMQQKGFSLADTVFAGDSGNDLPVLTSQLQAVLVANATEEIRNQAQEQARKLHTSDALYVATGNFKQMNGNYSAGILEGLAHYIPETEHWW